MVGENDTFSFSVILRSTSSAHHLEYILGAEFDPFALLWAVDLSSFQDDCVCWEINTPGKGCCGTENLKVASCEEVFNHLSIALAHSSMMNTEAIG